MDSASEGLEVEAREPESAPSAAESASPALDSAWPAPRAGLWTWLWSPGGSGSRGSPPRGGPGQSKGTSQLLMSDAADVESNQLTQRLLPDSDGESHGSSMTTSSTVEAPGVTSEETPERGWSKPVSAGADIMEASSSVAPGDSVVHPRQLGGASGEANGEAGGLGRERRVVVMLECRFCREQEACQVPLPPSMSGSPTSEIAPGLEEEQPYRDGHPGHASPAAVSTSCLLCHGGVSLTEERLEEALSRLPDGSVAVCQPGSPNLVPVLEEDLEAQWLRSTNAAAAAGQGQEGEADVEALAGEQDREVTPCTLGYAPLLGILTSNDRLDDSRLPSSFVEPNEGSSAPSASASVSASAALVGGALRDPDAPYAPDHAMLLRPCQCGGSMSCLHLRCLQTWIERRRMDGQLTDDALRCEVCKAPYRVKVHEKLDLSWARLCSNASVSFYAEFCTICATLASMGFLFAVAFAGRNQPQPQPDSSGIIALYTSLVVVGSVFVLGCFTLCRLMSRWRGALCVPLLSPQAAPL